MSAQNVTVYRGESRRLDITVAGVEDLTGYTLHYRIAKAVGQEPVIALDTADLTIDGVVVSVPLTTARTLLLLAGSEYYHELFAVQGGERSVLMTGTVTVVASQAARHT